MSAAKHTPGPWAIRWPDFAAQESTYHDQREFYCPSASISGPDWSQFALVYVMVQGAPDETGKANAALIAAAPDLLNACEAAAEALEGSEYRSDQRVRDLALAAIARAKGVPT